jgi:phage terminase large subunit-like protein
VSPFIPRRIWEACSGAPDPEAFRVGRVYLGLDLSARNDLTALAAVVKGVDGLWHAKASSSSRPLIGIRPRAARPRAVRPVVRRGLPDRHAGRLGRLRGRRERLCEWCDESDVATIAFDRWRIDVLKAELARFGRELPLKEHGQGFRDMSPSLDALEAELMNAKLRHGGNPILTWCAANAIAVKDPAGNRKLDKSKATGRIDGIVALAMAMGAAVSAEAGLSMPDGYELDRRMKRPPPAVVFGADEHPRGAASCAAAWRCCRCPRRWSRAARS